MEVTSEGMGVKVCGKMCEVCVAYSLTIYWRFFFEADLGVRVSPVVGIAGPLDHFERFRKFVRQRVLSGLITIDVLVISRRVKLKPV